MSACRSEEQAVLLQAAQVEIFVLEPYSSTGTATCRRFGGIVFRNGESTRLGQEIVLVDQLSISPSEAGTDIAALFPPRDEATYSRWT